MSDVFREVSFHYKGEEFRLVPSLALLRRIKAQGIHNVILANKCLRGGADLEDLAVVHAEFLREAGYDREETDNEPGRKITDEKSYVHIAGQDLSEITEFQMAYCQAVLPSVDLGKKQEARATKAKAKARARRKT